MFLIIHVSDMLLSLSKVTASLSLLL